MHLLPSLIELLQERSHHQPGKVAFTFLQDGDTASGSLTYEELDKRAQAIAGFLQSLTAKGERALLMYPQGLEVVTAFCGCLCAGVIAVPVPPPEPARLKRSLPRLQAIIKNAQASLILTTSNIKASIETLCLEVPEFRHLRWIATEEISIDFAQQWHDPSMALDDLAYLQYTSGSTSVPKGVMISHGNLTHNAVCIAQAARCTPNSSAVTWLPYFHDYGLVAGLIQPLYAGTPCFLMSPTAFIKRPVRWLQAISRYKATHSCGPNFAYGYCVRKISPEQREMLDLSHWQVASIAAEPIRQETLEKFIDTFQDCGFRAGAFETAYGLAEATLMVSCQHQPIEAAHFSSLAAVELERNRVVSVPLKENARSIAACGQPIADTKIVLVHPEKLTECPADEVGEIWVSGPSVALGYWNDLEVTHSTFQAYLADTGEGPFLRTGDLGFLSNGELFTTGRLKDLIIVGGTNHYPQDIELTVEHSHPSIRSYCSAAFSVDVNGQERLVVVSEVERRYQKDRRQQLVEPLAAEKRKSERRQQAVEDSLEQDVCQLFDAEVVIKSIRAKVSEYHDLRVYAIVLLKAGSIPKTSSGKIQRSACRENFLQCQLEVVSQWCESSSS